MQPKIVPTRSISGPIDDPSRRRLPILLRRSWYGLNQAFRRRIAHLQLTPDRFTVLRTLLEGDPSGLSQRELSERMGSDPNTIASLVERMQTAGLIERRPHEKDGRAHRILVRPSGKRKYREARAVAVDLQAQVLMALPEEEREHFLESLNRVAEACRITAETLSPGLTEGS